MSEEEIKALVIRLYDRVSVEISGHETADIDAARAADTIQALFQKITALELRLAVSQGIEKKLAEALEIERDETMAREYIPLPGGWEVQTKGGGSTLRLLDKKSGERHPMPLGEGFMVEFFERFAREVNAACRAIAAEKRAGPIDDNLGSLADWRIDESAGSPILVFRNCSVIQDEQAHALLALLRGHLAVPSNTATAFLAGAKAMQEAAAKEAETCDMPWNSPEGVQEEAASMMADRIATVIRAIDPAALIGLPAPLPDYDDEVTDEQIAALRAHVGHINPDELEVVSDITQQAPDAEREELAKLLTAWQFGFIAAPSNLDLPVRELMAITGEDLVSQIGRAAELLRQPVAPVVDDGWNHDMSAAPDASRPLPTREEIAFALAKVEHGYDVVPGSYRYKDADAILALLAGGEKEQK